MARSKRIKSGRPESFDDYMLGDVMEDYKSPIRSHQKGGTEYEIRFDRDITKSWVDEINTLKDAQECDTIINIINSGGGELYLTTEILSAIANCKAEVVSELVGEACSAASMIFLAGDCFVVHPFTRMMIHTASTGIIGSSTDIKAEATHLDKEVERLIPYIYKDFLHEDEIRSVLDGKPIYLNDEEIIERLQFRQEIREEEIAEALEDYMEVCTECGSDALVFVSGKDSCYYHCNECYSEFQVDKE